MGQKAKVWSKIAPRTLKKEIDMEKAWEFILVKQDQINRVISDLKDIPEVEEIYQIEGGDFNLMVLVKGRDRDAVARLILQIFKNEPGIIRSSTFWTERC